MNMNFDTVCAMHLQEKRGYGKQNWLQQTCNVNLEAVDADCRSQMFAWCVNVADYCNVSRETVEIAMSSIDRFMATSAQARNDRTRFQLVCMAALYSSTKIHEPTALSPALVSRFSDGIFSAQDIEQMEAEMMQALTWRVNPPTSSSFLREFLNLIPSYMMGDETRSLVHDSASGQAQVALMKQEYMTTSASTIAYAALMNSLECFGLDLHLLGAVGYALAKPLEIDCNSKQLVQIQTTMYKSMAKHRPSDNSSLRGCPPAKKPKTTSALRQPCTNCASPRLVSP